MLIDVVFVNQGRAAIFQQQTFGEFVYHFLRPVACTDIFQVCCAFGFPVVKMSVHFGSESNKLGIFKNALPDFVFVHLQPDVVCPVACFEQGIFQVGKHFPETAKGFNVGTGYVAQQMSFNILYIFCFLVVDVAGNIQVKLVFFDFGYRYHAAISGDFQLPVKYIGNFPDVLFAEAVFVAVFYIALSGIDHKNPFAVVGVFFIQHDDGRRNTRSVKKVGRQSNDAFYISLADEVCTNFGFGIASEKHTVRKNNSSFSVPFEGTDNV